MSFLSTLAARRRRFRYEGEAAPCNLCGSAEKAMISTRDRFLNPLTNVICTSCGLIRVDPMPTDAELDRYYTDHYRLHYQNTLEPTPKTIERGKRGAEARLDMLAKFLKPGARILDIGAGGGEFLADAKKRGYEVEGVEPSVGFARYAERAYGVKVHISPLMKIDFGGRKFDLVHSFHVFEHLRDPIASTRLVHSLLKPDGYFYIAVPDMAEVRTPTAMFHFAHVHGFTYETLYMMAAKAGFEWISHGRKGAAQIFRRIEQPDPNWFRFPGHARELQEHFRKRGLMKHLLTADPYRRAWSRLKRKIHERKLSSPRA